MLPKVFLPLLSLFGLPVERAFRRIAAAGFDGVEVAAFRGVRERSGWYRQLAEHYGLLLRWHQPWSYQENPHFINRVLSLLRILPADGYQLDDVLDPTWPEKAVVYADRIDEARGRSNQLLQTCSVFRQDGSYVLPYHDFEQLAVSQQRPVAFDTLHYLEYALDARSVGHLPTSGREIARWYQHGIGTFGELIEEVHLNDFRTGAGADPVQDRNIFPGDGQGCLFDFCRALRTIDWRGVVTLEVQPRYLFPYSVERLSQLRQRYEEIWGE